MIHSFWVPSLAGKMDMIPGRVTRLALEPTRTGMFRGACAEYCGASHALMAFDVVVMEPQAISRRGSSAQAQPGAVADGPARGAGPGGVHRQRLQRVSHRCAARAADGAIGPDLTHVGSRASHRRRHAAERAPSALVRWIAQSRRDQARRAHAGVSRAAARRPVGARRLSGRPAVSDRPGTRPARRRRTCGARRTSGC